MSPKIQDPPQYESDDESIPPPPPPPPADSSKEAFIDNHNEDENGVSTPGPSKKWRILKKEAEHVLIPQDNLEDVAAASSAANGSPNPVQGYYRGVQSAQQDEEEEAGMDDIEIPSSSIVARLNGIERKLRRKKTLVRTGLIFLILLIVIIAVTTGSIYGTRKKSNPFAVSGNDPLLKTPASKYLSKKYPSITDRTMTSTLSPQYRALEWINDSSVNGNYNYADEATFESAEKAFEFEQRYAAACFYSGLTEEEWVNSALWMTSEPLCNWHGIACNEDTVVKMELTDNLMRGILAPEISLMSGLQQLLLDSNWIRGTLPTDFSNLKALVTLDLFDNLMTGTLPQSFSTLSELTEMYLGKNKFSGTVPELWKQMDKLEYLWLDDLSLSGNIPSVLFEMQSLLVLKMSNSGLSGTIPSSAGDLATITYLNLSGNAITGGIPSSIQNLPLETLSMGDNPNLFDSEEGSFPDFLSQISTLQELDLSNTGLSGEIPAFVSTDFPELTALDLSKNNLSGTIPLSMAYAANLALIALNENQLEGELPWSFADLTNLEVLNLSNNKLTGTIPSTSWANAASFNALREIRLSNNYLEGELPDFQGLDLIEEIHFDGNVFEGDIPQFISDLSTLVVLNLSNNNFEDSGGFTGTIPAAFANLDDLRILNIEGNSISGTVPAAIANMESLEEFYFFDNQITSVNEAICSLNLGALMGGCSISCSCCTDSCRF
jgi:Leucine-rich repeat (LRR) protein